MKDHLISDKVLFVVPFLLSFVMFLSGYNNMFAINGSEYEFFFYEVLILTIIAWLTQIAFYFLITRIITNKRIVFVNSLLFLPVTFEINISRLIVFFLIFIISLIIDKKDNKTLNVFLEVFSTIITIAVIIVLIFNIVVASYKTISYGIRIRHYSSKEKLKIDSTKPSPNIYWFHMDGVPSTNFVKNYYNEDLTPFVDELSNMDFIVNEDASFIGSHHTIVALNALINPNYYDKFLKDYLIENDKCTLNSCKTKKVVSYEDLSYRKMDSELINGLKKKGYTTIGINKFNQYTALNTDYVYDISLEYPDKCNVPFFKNDYSKKEIYKNTLRTHFNEVAKKYYDYKELENPFYEKNLKCNINMDNYPIIDECGFLPIKETLVSLEDSKNIDNNPKFYFIDNSLIHKYWNYDKDGNFIRLYNSNLKDYGDSYLYTTKIIMEFIRYINDTDENSIIIFQGDHGIHVVETEDLKRYFNVDEKEVLNMRNSTISLISIPEEFKNGDELYLNNPLNISRYLINNFVGDNYSYIDNE